LSFQSSQKQSGQYQKHSHESDRPHVREQQQWLKKRKKKKTMMTGDKNDGKGKEVVKSKDKVTLRLIKKAVWHEDKVGSGDIPSSFLISALDIGEWSVSRTGRFDPGEKVPNSH
jgi:hypothetical protein